MPTRSLSYESPLSAQGAADPSWRVIVAPLLIVAVTSLYCLHMMRNVSGIYPILACISAIAGCLIARRPWDLDRFGLGALFLLAAALLYSVIISFVQVPGENYFLAIARIGFIAPYALFVLAVIDTDERMRVALKTFAVWTVIAGGTLIYQNLFGAIDWFADPSERAGAVRYASLAGSLTAYGVAGGVALPIVYYMFGGNIVWRPAMLAIIMVAMLMSLQKAAVMNVSLFWVCVIAVFVTLAIRHKRTLPLNHLATVVVAACIVAIVIAGTSILPRLGVGASPPQGDAAASALHRSAILATVDNVVRFDTSSPVTDVSILESVVDRFFALPRILFERYGLTNMLVGVGLVGGSGTLGFDQVICSSVNDTSSCKPKYPMAHNGLVEMMAMGGVILLFAFSIVCIIAAWRISKMFWFHPDRRMYAGLLLVLVLYFFNVPFTSGILSQPYLAGIFFVIIIPVMSRRNLTEG